jgi:uncharacterized protein YukE
MDFHASPELIDKFAGILDKQHDHVGSASTYAKSNLTIAHSDEGWITQLLDKHEVVYKRVLADFKQLAVVCETDVTEMRAAGAYYRATDDAVERRFDATLPGSGERPVPPFYGPFTLAETMAPTGRLTAPVTPDEFADPMLVVNTLNDLISPGYWVGEVLGVLINCNPAEEVSRRLAGDWQAVAKCGSAFNSLGFFDSDVGVNIMHNHRLLLNEWVGKAANASFDYFTRLAAVLEQHKTAFESLRDSYQRIAMGVWRFAKLAKDMVQSIFDAAFWVAVEAAAGGVLAESVVGPAVLWSVAALECLTIVRTWGKLLEMFNAVQNIMGLAVAEIDVVLGSQTGFAAHPLPGSYQHPAVK